MHSHKVKDISIFFLIAVISVALASFLAGLNSHITYLKTSYQTAFVGALSLSEERGSNVTDYKVFLECFHRSVVDVDCERADFDSSGTIDSTDAGLMGALSRFDINQDGVVVLHYPSDEFSDYEALAMCWQYPDESLGCSSLDFNNDFVVDGKDNDQMQETIHFDLNNNKKVEWR